MSDKLPPPPGNNLHAWAMKMYEYMVSESPAKGRLDPAPILLSHIVAGRMERASVDGIVLYNPTIKAPVVSIDGAFVPLLTDDAVEYGVMPAGYALTFSAALQKLFNWSAAGALAVEVGRYRFDTMLYMIAMAPTDTMNFSIVGTGSAVLDDGIFQLEAQALNDGTTGMGVHVSGSFNVATAGTIIPSCELTAAVAVTVGEASTFFCRKIATTPVTTKGTWT